MTTEAEHKVDRSGWPPGPWDSEPDREEWRSHGMPCLVVRNDLGGLCGYVGVPPGHPHHGKGYDDVPADVHGGLTYSEKCAGHICHVAQPGEPDDVWWLGFDCVHLGDARPSGHSVRLGNETYKTMAYVRAQTERLAEQMATVKP